MRGVCSLSVLLASLLLLAMRGAAGGHHKLPDGSGYDLEVFRGVPKWRMLPYLWTERVANVTCPGSKGFSVYLASTPDQLEAEYRHEQSAWCGLWQWGSESCLVNISPFKDTIVAARKPAGASRTECQFEVSEHLSPRLMVQGLAGAALFFNADLLTHSTFFRLGTGTLGFTALSLGIVLFILYRSVPNKKTLMAGAAMFGSSMLGVARWFFGAWIPSYDQLIYNKWMLSYLVLSGLVGLAVTYYYDDPGNVKLNNILAHGLEVVGLLLVATSTTLPEVSVALAVSLVGGRLFMAYGFPRLQELKRKRMRMEGRSGATTNGTHSHSIWQKTLDYAAEMPLPGDIARMVKRPRKSTPAATPATPPASSPPKALAISPLVQSGLIVNELTGRTIHIGKPTFNKLISEGFVVDEKRGFITPPPKKGAGRPKSPASPRSPKSRKS